MDALIERIRDADPASPDEFAGLANFDALVLDRPAGACARGSRSRRSAP